jgi:hypothetical protein
LPPWIFFSVSACLSISTAVLKVSMLMPVSLLKASLSKDFISLYKIILRFIYKNEIHTFNIKKLLYLSYARGLIFFAELSLAVLILFMLSHMCECMRVNP